MTPKTVTLVFVCAVAIAGLLGPGERSSSAQQDPIRKEPACTIFCGDGTFNTINLGAKPCWGGPLPAEGARDYFKSLAEEDQAAICQNLAAANKGKESCPAFKALAQLCKEKKPPDGKEKKPCDTAKLCAAINSAYESVSRALDTLNSGGRPPTSYADFKANLSRQLDKIQEELERCHNPSGTIGEVKRLLAAHFDTPRGQLEDVQRALNRLRVDFMTSGGPCYAMPPSTRDSPGGDPPGGDPPPPPPKKSPSGGGAPEQLCKEGEKAKTTQDNAAINQLIRALGQDISKLEQQARVLRGSRTLAAVRAKIEKLKRMRAFWQQVAAVPCLPPEIPESVRSYLQERQAKGDTADECSQLCSATSAWVEQQTNSNLQINFSMDRCLASCK
jgi:hypothetical protein